LDDTESKYAPYLMRIKQRIETVWSYPDDALHQKLAGTNMLRFTVEHDGSLVGVRLLTRSGNNSLDLGSIRAVRSAAPFDPIPGEMKLNRLHIIATFDYRIVD
ncbi:MAG: TonB family protein, partial [Syntrophales bacterium]